MDQTSDQSALAQNCACGSDKKAGACCMKDTPCDCGSGMIACECHYKVVDDTQVGEIPAEDKTPVDA